MDKQKQNDARPQGFRGNYRSAQEKVQETGREAAPEKKKAAPKPKKRPAAGKTKRRARKKGRGKKIAVAVLAVLFIALVAGGVIRIVKINSNKTVHMLPEIYDIETPEPKASAAPAGEGAPEALDNFIAEGAGT